MVFDVIMVLQAVDDSWRGQLVDDVDAYVVKSFESIKMYQGAVTPIGFVISGK